METPELKDRRAFERIPVDLPLRFVDMQSNKEGQAQTRDISANGIGLFTDEELPPYTPLEMWLKLPDKTQPLYTKGRVVWSRWDDSKRYRVGVCLDKVDLMGLSSVLRYGLRWVM